MRVFDPLLLFRFLEQLGASATFALNAASRSRARGADGACPWISSASRIRQRASAIIMVADLGSALVATLPPER